MYQILCSKAVIQLYTINYNTREKKKKMTECFNRVRYTFTVKLHYNCLDVKGLVA